MFLTRHATHAFSSTDAVLAPDAESCPCSLFGFGAVSSPIAETAEDAACRTPRTVSLFDNEYVPLMVNEVVPPLEVADPSLCLLPVAEVEIASQAVPAAKTLPCNNAMAAGSSHTPTLMAPSIHKAKAHHSPASMACPPPTSAYRPALPPASAFRRH